MTTREALVYDRRRPSGKRASVLALSPEQRAYRRANMTRPQEAQAEMHNAYEKLGEALGNFQMFDATGHPEDWLPHTIEALDAFLASLLGFQREVNPVVASDPYFITVRERQNLAPIDLNSNVTPAAILEDALRLSEGASFKAARVVKHMVHGLELREVN